MVVTFVVLTSLREHLFRLMVSGLREFSLYPSRDSGTAGVCMEAVHISEHQRTEASCKCNLQRPALSDLLLPARPHLLEGSTAS